MTSSRYAVELTRLARKDLDALAEKNPSAHREAVRALARLEDDADAGHPLPGSLRGCRSLSFSVQGSGQYRTVYIIAASNQACVVFIVGPHENIYRLAERRARAARRLAAVEP